jgi:hypothetical protein
VYTCPDSGASVVLIADQVLWFGNELHCSLINPHQKRSHGFSVCDDPWDPHRALGIDLDSLFIPLIASGPNLQFESRVPTDWEVSNLPIIEITAPTWNPADLQMSGPRSTMTRVVDCIDRSAGCMVPIDSTPHGDFTRLGFAMRLLVVCKRCPRARCTSGDNSNGER